MCLRGAFCTLKRKKSKKKEIAKVADICLQAFFYSEIYNMLYTYKAKKLKIQQ